MLRRGWARVNAASQEWRRWERGLPLCPADAVTDKDVLAAIARGKGNPTPEQELPPRHVAAHAAKEG